MRPIQWDLYRSSSWALDAWCFGDWRFFVIQVYCPCNILKNVKDMRFLSQITFYDSFLNNLRNSTLDAQQMHGRAPWTSRTLCIMAAPFCISTAMHECHSCSSSSPMLVILDIFNFSHSTRWAVASHCISLMINDLEPLFT